MTKNSNPHNCASMHCELKKQYAWEYIMTKYGAHYADECVMGNSLSEVARQNPTMTPQDLANYAMSEKR